MQKGVMDLKLKDSSILWAINHVINEKDTDLFPIPAELEVISGIKTEVVNILRDINVEEYMWEDGREFIVPKAEFSYRVATQLNPLDSIFLAAIIYEYGNLIERKRRPIAESRVFNYRFKPNPSGELYDRNNSWQKFWNECKCKAQKYSHAIYVDIADFYNQIYHHSIENQLDACGFPREIQMSLKGFFSRQTVKVTRGIPIGPHSTHLIAEMCLIDIDNNLVLQGYDFCRFSDDMILFANSENEARLLIYKVANLLNSEKLILQQQKTKLLNSEELIEFCDNKMKDAPMTEVEENMYKILKKYDEDNYNSIDSSKFLSVNRCQGKLHM